jgi:hypothetical protein
MDRLDAAGGHPRIAITPFVSIGLNDDEDEPAFEVVVEGTTEETP